ncbi:MAG TPA: glycosyltransferase family 4 protein [Candidatus Binataceae bacterium]|nr:glycosyltransferase family 4 protein [Candidatus Binataceae bacterium]
MALNRRLANEIARIGNHDWEVTAVAPAHFAGDLGPVALEHFPGEICRLEGIRVFGSRSPHMFVYGPRLRSLMREQWDFIHCWEEPYVFAGGQVAAWSLASVPLAFFTAQNRPKNYPPPFSWIEKYCLRRSSGWIAAGSTVAQAQLPRGYDARPYRVIPHGVDLKSFYPNKPAGSEIRARLEWSIDGPPVVGFLGRFVPEKGLDLLTSVLDRIKSPWRAMLVGGGAMEDRLRQWARAYPDRVRIVTGVNHDQVPAYLNAMDLLCAPSQSTPRWREQFGRMLIEAFACGVPVIASDSGEIPNVVGEAGVIVAENDRDAWLTAIGELLENPTQRVRLAGLGLERAPDFSWPVVARQHVEFFNQILDAGDHRASA